MHIGQVVDLHLIVQGQRVIALAPVVADALFAIDDQRIDIQLLQAGGDAQAGLSAADDEHGGIMIVVSSRGFSQIEPVRPAKIPRIGVAARTLGAELLLKTLELAKLRQQRPGLWRVAIVGIRDQPDNSAAAPHTSLELEDRFDRVGARAHHLARRPAVRIDRKRRRHGAAGVGPQLFQDLVRAVDGLDVPAQCQHVAPVALLVKQGFQRAVIGLSQRGFELRQPVIDGERKIVGFIEHARFSSPAVYAAFSLLRSLYPFGMAQKGREEMPDIP